MELKLDVTWYIRFESGECSSNICVELIESAYVKTLLTYHITVLHICS